MLRLTAEGEFLRGKNRRHLKYAFITSQLILNPISTCLVFFHSKLSYFNLNLSRRSKWRRRRVRDKESLWLVNWLMMQASYWLTDSWCRPLIGQLTHDPLIGHHSTELEGGWLIGMSDKVDRSLQHKCRNYSVRIRALPPASPFFFPPWYICHLPHALHIYLTKAV